MLKIIILFKILIANKVYGIKNDNKLIEKSIELKTKKLSKSQK